MIKEYIWGTEDWIFQNDDLLIKIIDSHDKLSVQVHPIEKTESWYIDDASDDAFIYLGCSLEDNEAIKAASLDGSIENYLYKVPVKKGDFFYIPWGTIHAIGPGCKIVEVQQNCNITYRLYDYKRLGTDGKPRELHLDQGISVIRKDTKAGKKDFPFECEFFKLEKIGKADKSYIRINDGLFDVAIL